MDPTLLSALVQRGLEVEQGALTLFHATSTEKAADIERTLLLPTEVDEWASLPGRPPVRKVWLASSPDVLRVIPHASVVVRVTLPASTPLELGEGDNPGKGWIEVVYVSDDPLALLSADTLDPANRP